MGFFSLAAISLFAVISAEMAIIQNPAPTNGMSWTYRGCYTDSVSARSLQQGEAVAGGTNAMTHEACQTACLGAGFTISGTEYGGECWCDNSFKNGGALASDGNSLCNMACKGNAAEACGGSNRLTVYQYASPGGTSASFTGTEKRGLAYNSNNPNTSAIFANMFKGYTKISWGYDWGYPSYGLDSFFEFVPMLWGKPGGTDSSQSQTWAAAVQITGVKNILGFNEPDLTYDGSSNLLPASAADGYKTYIEPFRTNTTANIGTPNILWNNDNSYSSGGNYNSRVWMLYFLGNCTGCNFDFAAIHYYQDCNPSNGQDGAVWFKGNVTDAYNALKLPIWVTEFQCYGTETQQIAFLQNVVPWLDAQTYVDRYAYFGVFPGHLINTNGTALSALGVAYATI